MSMIIDGTNGLTFNNATTQASAGQVLQIQSTTKTDTFSSSSTSMVDITGLSVSITPKFSTSKILVSYQVCGGCDSGSNQDIFVQLVRGSTAIGIGTTGGAANASGTIFTATSTYITYSNSLTYLDSPATTSATTYKLQGMSWNSGTTFYINRRGLNSSFVFASTITVMEIAQ